MGEVEKMRRNGDDQCEATRRRMRETGTGVSSRYLGSSSKCKGGGESRRRGTKT